MAEAPGDSGDSDYEPVSPCINLSVHFFNVITIGGGRGGGGRGH